MSNFYETAIKHAPCFLATTRVSDATLLEPETLTAVSAIINDALEQGHDLRVFETYRSQKRQDILFHRGATRLRTVGTHHYGLAADLVAYVEGEPNWKVSYHFLGELAAKHGLVWGGGWSTFPDSVHVQRCALARQKELFAGKWYPGADYNAIKDSP